MGSLAQILSTLIRMLGGVQVMTTISRGRLAWHDGEFKLESGTSRFVPTPPNNPQLFSGIDISDASSKKMLRHVSKLDTADKLTGILSAKDEL
jgi:hypothetical protein